MSTITEHEPLPCRADNSAPDEETWYCTTHAGWVYAEDECEGGIGSLHCNQCVATGCHGLTGLHGHTSCDCHDPADARYQAASA